MILYLEDLNDMADAAIAKVMPGAIVSRGLLIMELVPPADTEGRGVVAAQLGRAGAMRPWEALGLMEVISIGLRGQIAEVVD